MHSSCVETVNQNSSFFRKKHILHACQNRLTLGCKTKIMGIINCTLDSFSQDGCLSDGKYNVGQIVQKVQQMVRDGADIIDIGGESTRPGAQRVSAKEEVKRVIPAIQRLAQTIKKPISIDTYKPYVAKHALDAGVSIVNNIMGTKPDIKLLKMVKKYNAAIVLMHIRGNPKTMQKDIHYENLLEEIKQDFLKSIEKCLEIGIKSDKIIIDPGIGFGKTVGHNLKIVQNLAYFKCLDKPILIGPSRKSFIGKVLRKQVHDRLLGTAAAVSVAVLNGSHIVRVHDVKEMKDVVKVTDAILNNKSWLKKS